jgi:hypothetical protein
MAAQRNDTAIVWAIVFPRGRWAMVPDGAAGLLYSPTTKTAPTHSPT